MRHRLWIFLSLFVVLLSGCGNDMKKNTSNNTDIQKKHENNTLTLRFIDSNETVTLQKSPAGLALKESPSRLLLVDLFATWCPPCKAEVPVLSDLQRKLPNKLLVLGVSIEENIDPKQLLQFKQEHKATYKIVSPTSANELIESVIQHTGMGKRFAIPLLALYKDGKLIRYYTGATEEEFLLSDIKQVLGK